MLCYTAPGREGNKRAPPKWAALRNFRRGYLLREDLLEPGVAGQGVLGGALGLALDEGQGIVDEVLGHALAVGEYPLGGDLLLKVGDTGEGHELGHAVVLAVHILAGKGDHLAGLAADSGEDRDFAGHEGLVDVGLGGEVSAAALEQGELYAADLGAGLLLDDGSEQRGEAAELGVAEAVGSAGLGLGDEAAVCIVDAL